MNPINKKPSQQSDNVFYGVNVNDKEAVLKEYNRLKARHRDMTILVIIVLIILGGIIFDFIRVNTLGGKPFVAVSRKVDNGTLFSGLGYKVLYCDDGSRYVGAELYKTCNKPDVQTFSHVVYEKLMDYGVSSKKIDDKKLSSLVVNNVEFDETNDEGGSDYLVDISYVCSDGNTKCFKLSKEYNDYSSVKIYVRFNKFNEIYDVLTFKSSGLYYEALREDYGAKVKKYLADNQLLTEENLKNYTFSLTDNNGKLKFRGITYADSYLIKIEYMCVDTSNTCIDAFDKKDYEGDYSNFAYYASMLLDKDNNVILVGPREYLSME